MASIMLAFCRTVSVVSEDITAEVRNRLAREFGEQDLDRRVTMAIECVKRRAYITVFRQDGKLSGKNIDESILRALLKGGTTIIKWFVQIAYYFVCVCVLVNQDRIIQLKLALAWNQIDLAQTELFHDDSRWQVL